MSDTSSSTTRASTRASVTQVLLLAAGALLFFTCFGAVFVGAWGLLTIVVLCYGIVGAVAARMSRVQPVRLATLLLIPSLPFMLMLFPGAVAEAGLRALLWPATAGLMWCLAWFGGWAGGALHRRSARPARTEAPM